MQTSGNLNGECGGGTSIVFCQKCNVCVAHISPGHSSVRARLESMDNSSLHREIIGTSGPLCISQRHMGGGEVSHAFLSGYSLTHITNHSWHAATSLLKWREMSSSHLFHNQATKKRVSLGPISLGASNGRAVSFDFVFHLNKTQLR